jgi:thymidylate synthase
MSGPMRTATLARYTATNGAAWPKPDGGHIDQITQVVNQLKNNPDSRRIMVSAWNVADVNQMALPTLPQLVPVLCAARRCHQRRNKRQAILPAVQRSADIFLGVPFNIASYALLTMMMAQVCDLDYGDFIHTFGDAHIYNNHLEQAKLQLSREPKPLPTMKINPDVKDIFGFKFEDFTLKAWRKLRVPELKEEIHGCRIKRVALD